LTSKIHLNIRTPGSHPAFAFSDIGVRDRIQSSGRAFPLTIKPYTLESDHDAATVLHVMD
jgi:hypothetical protein